VFRARCLAESGYGVGRNGSCGLAQRTSLTTLLSFLSLMPESSGFLASQEFAKLLSGCEPPKEILTDKGANEKLLTCLFRLKS